jgi:protocatechuate 3,4-dioxygenase alpha subunit
LVTRLYFPGEDANDADPALSAVPEEDRMRLVGDVAEGSDNTVRFNIVLQGDGETPFFED